MSWRIEDENQKLDKTWNMRLTTAMWEELKKRAEREGRSMGEVGRELLALNLETLRIREEKWKNEN